MTKILTAITRRSLLAWLTAGTIVTPAWARPLHGGASSGGGSGLMSVQIVLSGMTYTYTESGGTNLGNYVGPNFTQKNIKGATSSGIPNFCVYFRQDTTGGRKEVVFANYSSGNLASMSIPIPPVSTAINLGTYTVQIFTGGVLETGGFVGPTPVASSPVWSAGTITPANHWFGAEWRWQSALRPILNTPATIMSNGWMLNMGTTGISATIRSYDNSSNVYTSPMDAAGMVQDMHRTGGRPDIGLITEWVAQWMISPNSNLTVATELAMRSGAEAAHSIPQCIRDDATHAPISFTTYPTVNWYPAGAQGTPNLLRTTDIVSNSSGWTIANDHFPANSIIAFYATGDRYYLEGTIFEITGAFLESANLSGGVTIGDPNQDRSWAWTYRSIGMAYIALKIAESWGSLPSDLPPSSNWAGNVTACTDFFYNTYINVANNYSQQFGSGTVVGGQETWEADFNPVVYYWLKKAAAAVSGSFTNLAAVATYKAQAAIDRTSGSTGWPVAFPVPYSNVFTTYSVFYGPPSNGNDWHDVPGPYAQGVYAATWTALWTLFWQNNSATFMGYLDGSTAVLTVTSMTSSPNYNNIASNWNLDAGFLPSWPLQSLQLSGFGTGTGGTGTYNVIPVEIFGNGCDIPTASPCNITFSGGGQLHGMSIGQKFRFQGAGVPTPVVTNIDYFVIAAGFTTTSFQFSTSSGGSAVNVTGSRSGHCYVMPYIGTSGSPVAMSVGNGGNSLSIQIKDALAIDQYNGGFFAQQGGDIDYLIDTQAAVAAASQSGQTGASAAFAHLNTMSGNAGQCMYYRFAFTP